MGLTAFAKQECNCSYCEEIRADGIKPKVYLAGPDVFLANAKEVLAQKKEICAKYGMIGLSPLDTEFNDKGTAPPTLETARKIFEFDCGLMLEAHAVLANMEPFRGPSMDTGTSFEMGFMKAQGKPVVGYAENQASYRDKYITLIENLMSPLKAPIYDKFQMVEDFGLMDNLMMVEAVRSQGIEIAESFEEAVKTLAKILGVYDENQDKETSGQEG